MNLKISPGQATDRDRRVATARALLATGQLPRIRTAALAWRNGIGALLVGLVGFGLVKGRTDVSELARPWDAIVGGLLLVALGVGSAAAWLMMRAAHGRPSAVSMSKVVDASSADPILKGEIDEAEESATALRRGVLFSFCCALLLCAAVGLTWYGPARDNPRLLVHLTGGDTLCGEVVNIDAGKLILKAAAGPVTVDVMQINGLQPIDTCSARAS